MPEERGVSTYNKLAPLYVQSTKYLESKMKRSRLAKLATYCLFLKKKKKFTYSEVEACRTQPRGRFTFTRSKYWRSGKQKSGE